MGLGSLTLARRLRISAVVLILAWFFLPGLQDWIPLWLPFLAFAGARGELPRRRAARRGSPPSKRGRIPQATDIDELGGEEWLEPVLVEIDGHDVWLPAGGESDEEVEELIEAIREQCTGGAGPRAPSRSRARSAARRRCSAGSKALRSLAALAFVLLVLVPRGGWDGLDEDDRDDRSAALLEAGGSPATTRASTATPRARRSASSSTPTASPRSAAGTPT